jgi:peptidoglycan/xylan/chitin deacetylase (PgdA/CDA1 family)
LKIITLGYHDIVDEGSASEHVERVAPSRYTLGREVFRHHLEAFRKTGVELSTVGCDAPSRVLLTFDDGAIGGYHCAAEDLEDLGWRGHFFVTSDWIGRDGFMNGAQICELRRRGHVIGSHTVSHPSRMSRLPWDELMRQWTLSRAILSDLLGEDVTAASVSDGYYSANVGRAAAAAGLKFLFNSEPTTEVGSEHDCSILGRYSILADTSVEEAAGLAAGRLGPHLRQTLSWKGKKLVKAVAGESYLTLRRLILSKR